LKTDTKKLYEGMFLVDSALAASDWDGVNANIKTILERSDAEIVSIKKWDERRLAYEINKKLRGTYILCYFKADGRRIREIERNVQLTEKIMRALILSTESMSPEDIERETPAMSAEKKKETSTPKDEATEEPPEKEELAEELPEIDEFAEGFPEKDELVELEAIDLEDQLPDFLDDNDSELEEDAEEPPAEETQEEQKE
jgi:small subunit ribosomal protein S6